MADQMDLNGISAVIETVASDPIKKRGREPSPPFLSCVFLRRV